MNTKTTEPNYLYHFGTQTNRNYVRSVKILNYCIFYIRILEKHILEKIDSKQISIKLINFSIGQFQEYEFDTENSKKDKDKLKSESQKRPPTNNLVEEWRAHNHLPERNVVRQIRTPSFKHCIFYQRCKDKNYRRRKC